MKKTNIFVIRYIFWALTLCVMIMVFNLSSQTRTESSQLSGSITESIVKIIYSDYDSASEEERISIMQTAHIFVRKAAHFTAYFLIGAFSSVAMYTYNCKQKVKMIVPMIIGMVYAVIDEWHQSFVPGRGPQFTDVILDSFGCAVGILIVFLIVRIYDKRREKDER